MRIFVQIVVACLSLAAAATVHGQTDAATAEMLMRKSGMWEQLSGLSAQFKASFASTLSRATPPPTAAELARVAQGIDMAYSAERLRRISMDHLARNIDEKHVPALRQWFDTRIGKTVTQLEEHAGSDGRDPEVAVREGVALLSDLPDGRRQLIEELVKVGRAAEWLTNMNINTGLAAYQGATSVTAGSVGPSVAELKAALEAQRPQMMQAFAAISLATYAKIYYPLPTADLAQYVAFSKTEAATHYNDVAMAALDAALVTAAAEFGRTWKRVDQQ